MIQSITDVGRPKSGLKDAQLPPVNARRPVAFFIGATLTMTFVPTAHGDDIKGAKPLLLAFHVDLVGDQLKDVVATTKSDANAALESNQVAALPSSQPMEFNFIGLPVRLGMKDDETATSMGLEAGIEGNYEIALSQRMSLIASAAVSKTGYIDNSWGTDRASAAASLRYQHDGLVLALEPSWNLRMEETIVTQRDYAARARVAKTLFQDFDVSGGVSYGRHDAWEPADDYANATAYATLSYRIASRMKLDLSYAASYKLPDDVQTGSLSLDDLGDAANSAGPIVTMTFPLWDALDIAATYRYCRSEDDVPRRGSDRRIDDVQSFDMSAAWHSDDPDLGGINFTAAYAYDRLASTARNADEQSHAATFAMAIPF